MIFFQNQRDAILPRARKLKNFIIGSMECYGNFSEWLDIVYFIGRACTEPAKLVENKSLDTRKNSSCGYQGLKLGWFQHQITHQQSEYYTRQ